MDISSLSISNNVNYTNTTTAAGSSDKSESVKVDKSARNDNKKSEQTKDFSVEIKKLDSSVNKANKIFFKNDTHLQFKIHDGPTHDVIVKIVNDETGEVLKEIPPEKFIDMMDKICEIAGVFVDEKR